MEASLRDLLFEAEGEGRRAATLLQTDEGGGVYSRAYLSKLRRAIGLLRRLEDEAFALIGEHVEWEARWEWEQSVADEGSRLNDADSLLKHVPAGDYALAAKCSLDGSACEPDLEDIVEEAREADFWSPVEGLIEAEEEGEEGYAEWWERTMERAGRLLEEVLRGARERVEGPSYRAALAAAKAASKLREALEALCYSDFRDRTLSVASRAACVLRGLAEEVGGTAAVGGRLRVFLNPRVRVRGEHVEAFKRAGEALGRRIGFVLPDLKPGSEASAAIVLNDLANYVHVMGEEMVKRGARATGFRRRGRCYIETGSDRLLEELCIAWDKATSLSASEYIAADAQALSGMVRGRTAQIRLGNARGHAAEVEKLDGRARLKYYDYDGDVRAVMETLLEDLAGCACEDKPEVPVLLCECPLESREDAVKLGAALSRATTMDIRIM
ncbi:MAG: hypothetical protein DRJ67_03645, partial [Thermoprotei archaeon]